MKKAILVILSFALIMGFTACVSASNSSPSAPAASASASVPASTTAPVSQNAEILVAYFSQTGSTEKVANQINDAVGGTLFKISTAKAYPDDYNECTQVAKQEQAENAYPALANTIDIGRFDVVFIGYPIWWDDAPMAIYTFLQAYDWSGKTVIPFCTSASSSISTSVSHIRKVCTSAGWIDDGLKITQETNVTTWLNGLKLKENIGFADTSVKTVNGQKVIDLYTAGNIPASTDYDAAGGNNDGINFMPNMIELPAPQGTVKGAVLLCSGGAFQFRNNEGEGLPVAEELTELGYKCFVVNYRLRPYSQEEGALDLARAVRYVRSNAASYGIDTKDIAIMGFSAGGILAGEMQRNESGTINGTKLDGSYNPDPLDNVTANAAAVAMIYSFYGRLSVADNNIEALRAGNLPPTYYVYGTSDPFYNSFEANVTALGQAGAPVEKHVLNGMGHGFGKRGDWLPEYDKWLSAIFEKN